MCQLSSFLVLSAFSFSSSFDLNIFLKSDRRGFCTLLLLEMIATEISNMCNRYVLESRDICKPLYLNQVFEPFIKNKHFIKYTKSKNIFTKYDR